MKNTFVIIAVLSSLIFNSCGEDKTTSDIPKTNNPIVSTPEELKQLNAQLLANPNNAELYHKRAKYYFNAKDFSKALADMTKVMNIDSTKAEYFLTMSDIYFVNNKTGNAKLALEKAIQLDDKNSDAILKLAELYLYVNKSEKSMEYINMALKLNQYNAKAYFMKGMNYKDMKDTAKAISSMQTAVEQDQQYYHAYMQLGLLCAAQKNPLAVQYYKNAIRIRANSSEAWYDLGKYYQDVEDYTNALIAYNSLLKFDAKNKYVHYNLGAIHLISLKKYELAINHFTDAIKTEPKYVEAYYGRAMAYQMMGDIKTAIIDYQACLSINPKFEPARFKLEELK